MERQGTRPEQWLGQTIIDARGHAVATVTDVLLDSRTAVAAWVVVRSRRLSLRHHAVPVSLLHQQDGRVLAPVSGAAIRRSPRVSPGHPMTAAGELALMDYWRPSRGSTP